MVRTAAQSPPWEPSACSRSTLQQTACAPVYTALSEPRAHGCPVPRHLRSVLDGDPLRAPSITGAVGVTARGGDVSLPLGQDLSIGYRSHTASDVGLYRQESLTFQVLTAEA